MNRPGDDRDDIERQRTYRNLGYGIMIPTIFGSCVVVGCLLGYWLDSEFGFAPWCTLLGLLLGLAAGVREMLRMLKKMGDRS